MFFFCCLFILDLINSRKMECIKIQMNILLIIFRPIDNVQGKRE